MRKFLFIYLVTVCVLNISGCVSVPPVSVSEGIKSEGLASHVKFLAQRGLKGREPGTWESAIARRYIEDRFATYGLVPWGQAKDFEQSFGYGTNVVGVLPGSDANMSQEFVLVSAHYDHIGRDSKGRICPGAADNASGVAALLETAKQMSLFEKRPKRSVIFVAFDREESMLFGSFAFSCRKDVNDAKIVAVVNVDVLGRDFLDVVHNAVFIAGTEGYPQIREKVREFGKEEGIRILPIGTDLVGPRSDHAAFESRPIPCLFFSSGVAYKDYHRSTDTADKLNYTDIEKSAQVILKTVEALANGEQFNRAPNANDGYVEELQTLNAIISDVNERFEQSGIKKPDTGKLSRLAASVKNFLHNGGYDSKARDNVVMDATGLLTPYIFPEDVTEELRKSNKTQEEFVADLQYMQQVYINHRKEAMQGYKMLVAHILKYRPGLFRGMPAFEYEIYEIPDENISMVKNSTEGFRLNAMADSMLIRAECSGWLIKSFGGGVTSDFKPIDCEGTKEQIADYCLLQLRCDQENSLHIRGLKKILRVVSGTEPDGNYEELVQKRLDEGRFKYKAEWISSCISGGSSELSKEAISAAKKDNKIISEALCEVIADRNVRPDVRAAAIKFAGAGKNRNELLAMCDVLDDANKSFKQEYVHQFRKDYPFSDRAIIKAVSPEIEKYWEKNTDPSKTIGELAHERLKKVTKKDFGKDSQRWRKWIETHVK